MHKKIMTLLTAFTLAFATLSFVTTDHAEAKGYRSGKKSFTPSQNQTITPNKSQSSNIKQTTPNTKPSTSAKPASKSKIGSFAKGLLIGGLGGLLVGSLFAGLGPIGSILSLMINVLFFAGIIMLIGKAFKYYKKQRRREAQETWR
jgi:predicted lipid-binding transport protein (Tim44 family)